MYQCLLWATSFPERLDFVRFAPLFVKGKYEKIPLIEVCTDLYHSMYGLIISSITGPILRTVARCGFVVQPRA